MGSSRAEIKAQAIALHSLGYSCHRKEKRLRATYSGAGIPTKYRPISRRVHNIAYRSKEMYRER